MRSTIPRVSVTPNRRGVRSRELVLDAAERVMAEQGYEAASLNRVVEVSKVPISSVYHYFGSKDGVLLAVMERGADRFFASLPDVGERLGTPEEHLATLVAVLREALERQPDFLRLVLVMAAQPPAAETQRAHEVVTRVRDQALDGLRQQMAVAFDIRRTTRVADRLSRFALAAIDGAFVASTSDGVSLDDVLAHLPQALVAMREAMG